MKVSRLSPFLMVAFWPLTALVLFCDSRAVAEQIAYGQWLSGFLALAFLLAIVSLMRPDRQLLVALFVPLSALGEALFSLVFGLYQYRLGGIPVYVPFGHSILLGIGLMLADSAWITRHENRVRVALICFHATLIGGALIFFQDTLSAILGVIFFFVLRRKGGRVLYLIIGVLVLYVEILGTVWGCWVWQPSPFGVLHTTNPPVGAFACYVLADIMAMKCAARVEAWLLRRRLLLLKHQA